MLLELFIKDYILYHNLFFFLCNIEIRKYDSDLQRTSQFSTQKHTFQVDDSQEAKLKMNFEIKISL